MFAGNLTNLIPWVEQLQQSTAQHQTIINLMSDLSDSELLEARGKLQREHKRANDPQNCDKRKSKRKRGRTLKKCDTVCDSTPITKV